MAVIKNIFVCLIDLFALKNVIFGFQKQSLSSWLLIYVVWAAKPMGLSF